MTSFTLNLQGFKPFVGELQEESIERQFYRVPHDVERYNYNTGDLRYRTDGSRGPVRQVVIDRNKAEPEVYRLNPDIHVILDCTRQWLWRNLNSKLSDKKWSTLLGNGLAWTNGTGFPSHYNCVTGEEPDKAFPRFDQMRVCGGAILTGYEKDGLLYIESMSNIGSPLSTGEVLDRFWLWYWGTSVSPDGSIQKIPRLGIDGFYYPVIIPIFTSVQATLPLNELHKLPIGEPIPDTISIS